MKKEEDTRVVPTGWCERPRTADGEPVESTDAERTEYERWIAAHYGTPETAYGQCAKATEEMQAAFPALQRVRGFYYCHVWGERTHWWLVAEDGAIVDPTAAQFPSQGNGVYHPWIEGEQEPTGKCPNCDGYVYDGGTVCSDRCAREYAAYVMGTR